MNAIAPAPPLPGPAAAAPGRCVLYVDDDAVTSLIARRTIEQAGWRASMHRAADSALAALQAEPRAYGVLVTDHHMAGMSGLELARRVRAVAPGLRMVLATGLATDELRAEAAACGVDLVIDKPVRFEALGEAIRRVLDSV